MLELKSWYLIVPSGGGAKIARKDSLVYTTEIGQFCLSHLNSPKRVKKYLRVFSRINRTTKSGSFFFSSLKNKPLTDGI